ncbi:MAG: preprotein translocase subunit SecG [Armatimonadota bacterium]
MLLALEVISAVTALALIVCVVLQTSKAESFSAAMGGTDASQFRKGTREELLARLTKYFAIVWIVSVSVGTVMWYYSH